MRKLKTLAAALLCALLLTGCGVDPLSAGEYVQGLLDETYKGTWTVSYLHLVDLTSSELQETYRAGLEAEYGRFAEVFRLSKSLPDQTRDAFTDWLGEVCAGAQYQVEQATRSDSGAWLVEVTVQPILTLSELAGQADTLYRRFQRELDPELTSAQQEQAWADALLEECRAAKLTWGEAETIAVRLIADEDGYYSIGARDFYNLDALILPYTS